MDEPVVFVLHFHAAQISPVDLKAEQLERLRHEDDDDEDKDDDDEAVEMSGINSRAWLSQAFTVEIGGLGGESANPEVRGTSWPHCAVGI